MNDESYAEKLKHYKLFELREALSGIDVEKYPERARLLRIAIRDYNDTEPEIAKDGHNLKGMYANQAVFAKSKNDNLILSITTLGLYKTLWIYKSWKRYKAIEKSDISPFWRTFFFPFTSYYLFRRLKKSADQNHAAITIDPIVLAALVFISSANISGDSIIVTCIGLALAVFSIVTSVFMNNQAIQINSKIITDANLNERITVIEYIFMILGIVIWNVLAYAIYAQFNK